MISLRSCPSLFFLVISTYAHAQLKDSSFEMKSASINDKFSIYITLPADYQPGSKEKYSVVYYLDASIKVGKETRRMLKDSAFTKQISHCIFVGIGHDPAKYQSLRNRDLITPYLKSGDTMTSPNPRYGQIEHFYQFIKMALIPLIEKKYKVDERRTIIGHSLGGVFVFYCLFKDDQLFTNYIPESPSLWVNNYNIYGFEKSYHEKYQTLNAYLYLSCGSLEFLNRILYGNRQMKALLEKRNYLGLKFEYDEFPAENHNSETAPSMKHVLSSCRFH